MGKKQHPRVAILQGFAVPSTFQYFALLGFANLLQLLSHLHHAYRSSSGYIYHLQHLKRPPHFLYCLQHTTFLRSQSLLLIIVPFSLQVTCQCFPVAFYNQIQNVIFQWQPLTYYSRGYQMVCLFIFYSRRNAKIPFQGSNLVVQSQTILSSTFFNRIEIQPTHQVLQPFFH